MQLRLCVQKKFEYCKYNRHCISLFDVGSLNKCCSDLFKFGLEFIFFAYIPTERRKGNERKNQITKKKMRRKKKREKK